MILRWSKLAYADREEIFDYLARHNPSAALKIDGLLWSSAEALTRDPYLGRSGRVKGTREFPIPDTDYIIGYRVEPQAIRIVAVRHGARLWPKRLPKL